MIRAAVTAALLLAIPAMAFSASFQGLVVGVPDADMVDVLRSDTGRMIRVVIAGIDCPEDGQPYSWAARQYTADHAAGQTVTVGVYANPAPNRVIGSVTLADGKSLGTLLLSSGWAWWNRFPFPGDKVMIHLEAKARLKKIGLWQDVRPIPPWEWRNGKRK